MIIIFRVSISRPHQCMCWHLQKAILILAHSPQKIQSQLSVIVTIAGWGGVHVTPSAFCQPASGQSLRLKNPPRILVYTLQYMSRSVTGDFTQMSGNTGVWYGDYTGIMTAPAWRYVGMTLGSSHLAFWYFATLSPSPKPCARSTLNLP